MIRPKLNILIHGEPKTGKTSFAVRRNPGVLILDTEGSSKLIRGVKREEVKSIGQMKLVLNRIASGEIKMVVIDTLDELVNNFSKEEARRKGGDFVNKLGLLTQPGWGFMRDSFMSLTRSFRDAGADVLTVCHSENEDLPNGGKKMTMKLPSNYAKEVFGMMDVVGFLETVKDENGKNVPRLNLEKSPFYDAGCRAIYDAVEDKWYHALPSFIDNPAFVDIIKAYDTFFEGDGNGFAVKCERCLSKGKISEAIVKTDTDKMYCADCLKAYEAYKSKQTAPAA